MLSAQRIGAIIAIERQIGLRNYIEGGIPLDAVLTYDLLAEHLPADVAAARRRGDRAGRSRGGGRVLPAADGQPEAEQGARLAAPRGDRPDRGERRGGDRRVRGNRHASRSSSTARSSAASTPTRCARACGRSCSQASRADARQAARCSTHDAPIWPFRHIGLKLLSVGLAVLLWLVVSGEETVERGLRVPLELQQFPAGPRAPGRGAVDRRRARARRVGHAEPRRAPATSSRCSICAARAPGRRLFPLTPEQVRVPFGVEVVQVTPSTVALVFEPSATREVPVVAGDRGQAGARASSSAR